MTTRYQRVTSLLFLQSPVQERNRASQYSTAYQTAQMGEIRTFGMLDISRLHAAAGVCSGNSTAGRIHHSAVEQVE